MNKNQWLLVFFILIFAVGLICFLLTVGRTSEVSSNKEESSSETKSDTNILSPVRFEIFKLDRENFELFLKQPSYQFLENESFDVFEFSDESEYYITQRNTLFPINKEFNDFVTEESIMQTYLCGNGVTDNIEQIVVFEAAHIPLSILVKCNNGMFFVTVNEEPTDAQNTFRFYTQKDYDKKYSKKTGALFVNGKDILNGKKTDIYFDYADIPLVKTLEALGGHICKSDVSNTVISVNGNEYILNNEKKQMYNVKNNDVNLLSSFTGGGPYYMYILEGELYVDSSVFMAICSQIGIKVRIKIDNSEVVITPRDNETVQNH